MSRCKICRSDFVKRSMTHKCCSPECAKEYATIEREKKERKQIKERREAIKTRSQWLKEAERECNKYIRIRDSNLPCISCGATGRNMHAGHMRSVGSSQALRYYEFNIFGQCQQCNIHLGGNLLGYRRGLAEREGSSLVEYLENHRGHAKWTIDELREIKEYYREKWKELSNVRD